MVQLTHKKKKKKTKSTSGGLEASRPLGLSGEERKEMKKSARQEEKRKRGNEDPLQEKAKGKNTSSFASGSEVVSVMRERGKKVPGLI